ncbi:exported hypothetical protein [Rhodococcus sp. RD6.2]|uniref:hypothetical protein n=1 Tax=Rhodococcus sp. RD6.2 TaxID=260936 RepID=UPI00063B3DCB|nr:hypothetical protein [Rhodococcus sp. RD6.2]CRK51692.1 exported hypothetical protein [Rhodococcus sp. RD6.2]
MRTHTTTLVVSALATGAVLATTGTANAAATTMAADSTYIVGVDIEPGLYASAGPVDGDVNCWGTRLSGFSGEADDAIAYAYGKGRVVVDVKPTDAAFESWNCQPWIRIGDSRGAATVPAATLPVEPAAPAAVAPDLTAPLIGAGVVGSAVVGSTVLPAILPLLVAGSAA